MRFCSTRCRRAAWADRKHVGSITNVQRLAGGIIAVVVHMVDTGLRPGDQVHVQSLAAPAECPPTADDR